MLNAVLWRFCIVLLLKMHFENCKCGLSFMDTDLSMSKCIRKYKHLRTIFICFMKWSCHMVESPILKYKRPRNTFSTARDTISCGSMKANLFIRHYINVTEVLIQGLVFMCPKNNNNLFTCASNKISLLSLSSIEINWTWW